MFKKLIALAIVAAIGFGVWVYGPEKAYHKLVGLVSSASEKAEDMVTKENIDDKFKDVKGKVKKGGEIPLKEEAKNALASLKVTDNPSTNEKYNRAKDFGSWKKAQDMPGWSKELSDKIPEKIFNKCDTREAAVFRDGENVKLSVDCQALSGSWTDPYGWQGKFQTVKDPSKFDLDHVVPLKDAWVKGANTWDKSKREKLANDADNLIFPSASANRSKGSKSIDKYTPLANSPKFCDYVSRYVVIKERYGISVTKSEKKAIDNYSSKCGIS